MNRLKKVWESPIAKISVSFFGLIILLFTLTINPLITFFLGEDVPMVIYNDYDGDMRFQDRNFVELQIKDITIVSLDVFSGSLLEKYDLNENNPNSLFYDTTFYAIIEVENNRSFVSSIVDVKPSDGLYLEIDYLFFRIDPVRSEEEFDETGVYTPVYNGIQVIYPNLINVLDNRIPNLYETLETEEINITLRLYRGRYVIIEP